MRLEMEGEVTFIAADGRNTEAIIGVEGVRARLSAGDGDGDIEVDGDGGQIHKEDEVRHEDKNENRPKGSAFRQQKLVSWQPIPTASAVLPAFLVIGLVFLPVGVFLLITSNGVQEFWYDYTDCRESPGTPSCHELIDIRKNSPGKPCSCRIPFDLPSDFARDVFLYYSLTNYHQNHRRYVNSRDDKQMTGVLGDPSTSCEPYRFDGDKPIAPCGAVANSLFNDTFSLKYKKPSGGHETPVRLVEKDISWPTDKSVKFQNPPNLREAFEKYYAKPPYWSVSADRLDPNDTQNTGYLNEHFLVWMRSAALPTFKKLWARIYHKQDTIFGESLPNGSYVMYIEYNYQVKPFKGKKLFILSNTSWLGGKNPFLGVAYIVVGSLTLLLTAVLYYIHRRYGVRVAELVDIQRTTPYSGASSSVRTD